jgi:hypothetical protein
MAFRANWQRGYAMIHQEHTYVTVIEAKSIAIFYADITELL